MYCLLLRSSIPCRVIAAGGDGTVNWILSSVMAVKWTSDRTPAVAIIPLGTGNDTARTFGWGAAFDGARMVQRVVDACSDMSTPTTAFNRWEAVLTFGAPLTVNQASKLPPFVHPFVQAASAGPAAARPDSAGRFSQDTGATAASLSSTPELKQALLPVADDRLLNDGAAASAIVLDNVRGSNNAGAAGAAAPRSQYAFQFNNYFSYGLDSQILQEYHDCREAHRWCFCHRCVNLACVGFFGAVATCCCLAKEPDLEIDIRSSPDADWQRLPLPEGLVGLVLLNNKTYAGGRSLWGPDDVQPGDVALVGHAQDVGDGLLELVGLSSSVHLGCISLHCSHGLRLAQAAEVRISCRNAMHLQSDGEPWPSSPLECIVRKAPSAVMLVNRRRAS